MRFNKPTNITAAVTIIVSICLVAIIASKNDSVIAKRKGGSKPSYCTFESFTEMANAIDAESVEPVRISPEGSKIAPMYHGFFFYSCAPHELPQFDPSGRYLLGMRIFIEEREVTPTDKGEIGIFDLQDNNKWIKIGETTAWNFQQGCRLQWIPSSAEEIIWNDRSLNGVKLVSRIYNIRTNRTFTLPFPIYTISPDGNIALSINFERIVHKEGCKYVGVEDPYKGQWAPENIGIWEMDMHTGQVQMIMSLREMAKIMYPSALPADTVGRTLYFFREGFNPSGDRFIVFIKNARYDTTCTEGYSMNLEGKDIRFFYHEPSHHFWLNDEEIIADGTLANSGYFRYKDDGTGSVKEKYFDAPNGHITMHKNGEWFLTDTYSIDGFLYLYMYHIPTKKFVLLAKLKNNADFPKGYGTYGPFRVDLHPRFSPNGKLISFDSTHEGLGRQIYVMDISHIIDNPPGNKYTTDKLKHLLYKALHKGTIES
jgi:hypothetical protein